ncbi:hypothetical protein E2542_SST22198 [Spatholobus suberectus]|nr:hypothetical protein E2542_SST22198 [Spatholobus suberectus]
MHSSVDNEIRGKPGKVRRRENSHSLTSSSSLSVRHSVAKFLPSLPLVPPFNRDARTTEVSSYVVVKHHRGSTGNPNLPPPSFSATHTSTGEHSTTHENFEAELFEATSGISSSESSPLDPAEEERLRTQCWIEVADGKKKRRIYRNKELTHGYRCGDNNLVQQPQACSNCSHVSKEMVQLRQQLLSLEQEICRVREDNERLNRQFQSFVGIVLPFLPPDVQNIWQKQQEGEQQKEDDPHKQ